MLYAAVGFNLKAPRKIRKAQHFNVCSLFDLIHHVNRMATDFPSLPVFKEQMWGLFLEITVHVDDLVLQNISTTTSCDLQKKCRTIHMISSYAHACNLHV